MSKLGRLMRLKYSNYTKARWRREEKTENVSTFWLISKSMINHLSGLSSATAIDTFWFRRFTVFVISIFYSHANIWIYIVYIRSIVHILKYTNQYERWMWKEECLIDGKCVKFSLFSLILLRSRMIETVTNICHIFEYCNVFKEINRDSYQFFFHFDSFEFSFEKERDREREQLKPKSRK